MDTLFWVILFFAGMFLLFRKGAKDVIDGTRTTTTGGTGTTTTGGTRTTTTGGTGTTTIGGTRTTTTGGTRTTTTGGPETTSPEKKKPQTYVSIYRYNPTPGSYSPDKGKKKCSSCAYNGTYVCCTCEDNNS